MQSNIVSAIAPGCDETIALLFMSGHCGKGCSYLLAKDSTDVCHVTQIWCCHCMTSVPWTLHVYGQTAPKTRLSLYLPPSLLHSLTSHGNNIITILRSHLLHTIIVQLSVGERSQGFNFLPPLFFFISFLTQLLLLHFMRTECNQIHVFHETTWKHAPLSPY